MTPRSGLSLLELLLALALLAVISAALVSTVGLGIRLNERTSDLAEANEPLAARRLLRNLIAGALPPDRIVHFDNGFGGTPDNFVFITLAGRSLAPQAAALRVAVARQSSGLTLTITALFDSEREEPILQVPLAIDTRIEGFSYYDDDPETAGWSGTWSDPDRLPALIKIEAALDDRHLWPEFTVAPALRP